MRENTFDIPFANASQDKVDTLQLNEQSHIILSTSEIEPAQNYHTQFKLVRADKTTQIHEQIWGSCFILASLLTYIDLKGKNALELGSGTVALPSLSACRQGVKSMTATDVNSDCLPWIQKNAEVNGFRSVLKTRLFDWNKSASDASLDTRYDLIMASDILYLGRSVGPVLKTIQSYLDLGNGVFLLVDPDRIYVYDFIQSGRDAGYHIHHSVFENVTIPQVTTMKKVHIVIGTCSETDLHIIEQKLAPMFDKLIRDANVAMEGKEVTSSSYRYCI